MTIEQQVFNTLSEAMSQPSLVEIRVSPCGHAVIIENGKHQRLYFYPPFLFNSAHVEVAELKTNEDYRVYDTIAIITLHDRQQAKKIYKNLLEECKKRQKQDVEEKLSNFVVDKA
jgi:Zn-finger protein